MNKNLLIKKFFAGECTTAELAELHNLLKNDQSGELKDEFRDTWKDLKVYPVLDDSRSAKIMQRIMSEIKPAKKLATRNMILKYAAMFLLAIVSLGLFWVFNSQSNQIITGFGEMRKVILPDGSLVHLNANSKMEYNKDFLSDDKREVWLQGEAFFKVNELNVFHSEYSEENKKKFVVHVENLDIEVLGTQFNVKNRRGATEVVLDEGEVQLKALQSTKSFKLNPGDKATFDKQQKMKVEKINDPQLYNSWRRNEMYFDGNTLQQIADAFKDNFNINLIISDPELQKKKFTGFCPSDDPEILLKTLQKSFHLKLLKDESGYILQQR